MTRQSLLLPTKTPSGDLLVLATSFHPSNPDNRLALSNFKHLLTLQPDAKELSKARIMVAYKTTRCPKNLLVRSKFSKGTTKPSKSTVPCGKNCFCCPYIKTQTQITSHHSGRCFPIRHGGNRTTPNVIYVIQCRNCDKQYVGQTGNMLKTRLSGHLSTIRTGTKDHPIPNHFSMTSHNISDVIIAILDQSDDTVVSRFCLEQSWIDSLQTLYPWGLNILGQ